MELGQNLREVLAAKKNALASAKPVVLMSSQAPVLLTWYCHLPCAAVAALAVIATPAIVPSTSLKLPANSAETKAPAGGVEESSLTAASVAEPLATGASLTAVMLIVLVSGVHRTIADSHSQRTCPVDI